MCCDWPAGTSARATGFGFCEMGHLVSQFLNRLIYSFEAGFAAEDFEGAEERRSRLASTHGDAHGFEHLARFDAEGFSSCAQCGLEAVVGELGSPQGFERFSQYARRKGCIA